MTSHPFFCSNLKNNSHTITGYNMLDVGLPTFCFAIPGHLNTGASNLFKPRAILAHQKYWQAKQMKHLNFCPKLIVISQKKKVLT